MKETSTISWIITLLSVYCSEFSPKHLYVDIYNFCSPVCYHYCHQSHKMRTISPAMSYLWPTYAAVFDFVLFRIPVIYKADSLQLSQSGHFWILAEHCESTGATCHHHQHLIFCIFRPSHVRTECNTWYFEREIKIHFDWRSFTQLILYLDVSAKKKIWWFLPRSYSSSFLEFHS